MENTYVTQEQVCRMLHISKRKAKYILDNGIIPCINTGKKTRQYRVKLSDVEYYIEHPFDFAVGMFPGTNSNPAKKEAIRLDETILYDYFYTLLKNENDILTTAQVSEITGYGKPTIYRWLQKGWLHSVPFLKKHLIKKVELLNFITSPTYTTLPQKSPRHLQQIEEIKQMMKLAKK